MSSITTNVRDVCKCLLLSSLECLFGTTHGGQRWPPPPRQPRSRQKYARPPAPASPARASRPRPAITCAPSTPSRPPAHRRARTDTQRPQKLAATDFCFSFVLANGGRAGVSVCRRRSGGGVAWVASVWGGRRSVWRGCISAVCSVGALV